MITIIDLWLIMDSIKPTLTSMDLRRLMDPRSCMEYYTKIGRSHEPMDSSTYTREHIMPLHIEMVFADIGLVRYQHVGRLILQHDHIHVIFKPVQTPLHISTPFGILSVSNLQSSRFDSLAISD